MAQIALVLGVAALILGGSALGVAVMNSGHSGTNATSLWAAVDANGTVASGRGVNTTTTFEENGNEYVVFFDSDVKSCAYIATIGFSGQIFSGPYSDSYAVFVATTNSTGVREALPFYLAVFC
ncbi:MAG: hypothetical protein ACLQC7_02750 [Thermoplasmata archaeon]